MATVRLPGIYFESVTASPPALLPRMDVAAFAGFLPSGPIGIPLAVEDPDRFQDVFGVDLALAWDRQLNQMRLAQTAPAVRTFFRNGGKRCWVLRLAKNALANAWTVPGLLQVDAAGAFHAGWVEARSEGSWSDQLTVNATLLETPLPPQASGWPGTGSAPQAPAGLNAGDVVQLFYPQTQTFAFFDQSSAQWFWFEPALNSPPGGPPDRIDILAAGVDTIAPFLSFAIQASELNIEMDRGVALTIPPGCWLRLKFGSRILLTQVESIEAGSADETATLTSTLAWWAAGPAEAWGANQGQSMQASVVTFELWAWPQGSPVQQISGLGFSPMNPQYWGLLPTDAALYAPVTQPGPLPYAALAAEIDHPRFPLAGPLTTGLGLPLGMTALVRPDFTQGATLPGATALDRDGLTQFDQDLFIDPALVDSDSTTLLQDAYYVQNQAQNPRPLGGVHALLGIDEISIVAAPDAIHSGWEKASAQTATLGAPDPVTVSVPDENGNYFVSWAEVAGATGYSVEQSSDPLFGTGITSSDAGSALSMEFSSSAKCPLVLYFRVSAYGLAGSGPWSMTAPVELGEGDFTPCVPQTPAAPQLTLLEEANRLLLQWTAPGAQDSFTLETAGDPGFESNYTLYQGDLTSFQFWTTPGPPSYFRVSGPSSPWSNTVNSSPEPVAPWEVVPFATSSAPAVLMAVHQALLIMVAARGDQVAVLSLPYSFRQSDAVAYQALLAKAATADSQNTPSFGVLYHPWIVTPDNTSAPPQSLRTLVPDGAVCGVIASSALSSGAWIAPANIAIQNAVALMPVLEAGTAEAFAAAQINLIAQQPEGFLITAQNTLMPPASALAPLNVRRLLILLRRLALREGVRYVFQNNSPWLQRVVTRQFQQWMQILLARGAFAGSSAQDSYQVIADASVNPQDSINQGRFIVQLRVAPSVPMQFLTVKLVQSGGQLALVEG